MSGIKVDLPSTPRGTPPGEPPLWDLATYPRPAPTDPRERKVATERLLWRRDGSLCAAPGQLYFAEDEPDLITEEEWLAEEAARRSRR